MPAPVPQLPYEIVKVTGYGWHDNDCAGGGGDCTAYPPYHAVSDGTYAKPTTIAISGSWLQAGEVLYLPYLRRYVIVEDKCVGCHTGQIDIWVDGRDAPDLGLACMNRLTGQHYAVTNPPPGLLVSPGPIVAASGGCAIDTPAGWGENEVWE